MIRCLGFGIACLATIGCAPGSPDVYAVPIDAAYQKLKSGDLDDFRDARQCGILIHIATQGTLNEKVRWVVTSSGRTVASWTARLAAVDADQTRITIEVPKAPEGKGEIYDGTQFYTRPALHQPLRPAIRELIESRLEGRPFDGFHTPIGGENESVCNIQRLGLESMGKPFSVDVPIAATDSDGEANFSGEGTGYGEPMDQGDQ